MTDKKPSKSSPWNVPEHDPDNKTGQASEQGPERKNEPYSSQQSPWERGGETFKNNHDVQGFDENYPSYRKKRSFFSPLILILIVIFVVGFVGLGFTTGSDQNDTDGLSGIGGPNLVYNIMWLVFIGASILTMARKNLGQTLKHALGWGFILLFVVGGINIWMDLREQGGMATLMNVDQSYVEIPRQKDGHYYVRAIVNGQKIRFMVDTGATEVVLNVADGKRAGFNLKKSDFRGRASTANGTVAIAPVRLDTIKIGNIEINNIRGSINSAPLSTSLLGMSYLSKLSSFEFKGEILILNK